VAERTLGAPAAFGRSFELALEVNGQRHLLRADPSETLADVLRDRLGLTGTKVGCDSQVCGSCTVLLDRALVSACTVLAYEAGGRSLLTIEGCEVEGRLDPVQEAFISAGAFQCGFCTPGIVLATKALLAERPEADAEEVRSYLRGNLCRCTGYKSILDAVELARRGRA
jgi:carbon-monoxide dehydrogenase small subunit